MGIGKTVLAMALASESASSSSCFHGTYPLSCVSEPTDVLKAPGVLLKGVLRQQQQGIDNAGCHENESFLSRNRDEIRSKM